MSSRAFFFSSARAYFGLAVTPASFGPCSTFARAKAGSESKRVLPAPRRRNSRRRRYHDFGVTPDDRIRDLRTLLRGPDARGYVTLRRIRPCERSGAPEPAAPWSARRPPWTRRPSAGRSTAGARRAARQS